MKRTNLCFLVKETEVLLAMKKRGFGAGKWNGVGGKVLPEETVEQSVRREAEEEIGVSVGELQQVATLTFSFLAKPEWNQRCEVFLATDWEGEPAEGEEMAPRWFAFDAIPYAEMWVDDPLWLPRVLAGELLEADFAFTEDQALHSYEVRVRKQV